MNRIISLALEYRLLVLFVTLLVVIAGVVALQQLPIDAVPDITPNQVLVLAQAPGLSPLEVEQFLVYPVEFSMSGLPGTLPGCSRYPRMDCPTSHSISETTWTFTSRAAGHGTAAELREAIPEDMATPEMGPISTGLGEIYQFKVTGPGSLAHGASQHSRLGDRSKAAHRPRRHRSELSRRATQDLRSPGRQRQAHGLSEFRCPRLSRRLQRNNANVGGAYLERAEQQSLIRGEALITSLTDIEQIVVSVSPQRNANHDRQYRPGALRTDGSPGIRDAGRQRRNRTWNRNDADGRELAHRCG